MQKILSTLITEVSTIHPDLIIQVPFSYEADVYLDRNEMVNVRRVWLTDIEEPKELSINKNIPSVDRFLAHIREDARAKAYKQRKQNPVT